jgi:cyclohexyl-isocyanide hydratase
MVHRQLKVAILIFTGVEELDFVGFLETLAVANRVKARECFETNLVGVGKGPVTCSGGMRVLPDTALSEMVDHDIIFVPGGGASRGTGVDLICKNKQVLKALNQAYGQGKRVCSVCTGSIVLGKAGLLKGRRATTHHDYFAAIKAEGAALSRRRVVVDGRITTGGGISSSIDVGLALVEQELGEGVRREVQARMEYQSPYFRTPRLTD